MDELENLALTYAHGLTADLRVNIGHGYLGAQLESLRRCGDFLRIQFANTVHGIPYKRLIVRVPAKAVAVAVSIGDVDGPTSAVFQDFHDQLFKTVQEATIIAARFATAKSRTILTRHNVEVIPFAVLPANAKSEPELIFTTRFEERGHTLVSAGWDVPEYAARFGQARMHAKIPLDAVRVQLHLHEEKAKFWTAAEKVGVVPLGDYED